MKKTNNKFISCLIAMIVILSISICPMLSFAQDFNEDVYPPVSSVQDLSTFVNDELSYDFSMEYNQEKDATTFTYTGTDKVNEWQFPRAVEGKDYQVIEKGDNFITVKFINASHGIPYINAVVGNSAVTTSETLATNEETTTNETTSQNQTETSTEETTQKSEESSFSDNQKIVYISASIAVVIAVVLIIFAVKGKKKNK